MCLVEHIVCALHIKTHTWLNSEIYFVLSVSFPREEKLRNKTLNRIDRSQILSFYVVHFSRDIVETIRKLK